MIKKKVRTAVASAMVCVTLLCGCGIGNTEVVWTSQLNDSTVFRIQNEDCSLSDAKVFLVNYRNLYADIYGSRTWQEDHSGKSMEDYVKDVTLNQLAKMKTMVLLAQEKGISLTEEEEKAVSEAAETYYDSLSKEEIRYLNVSRTSLTELYSDLALATKLYTKLTGGVDEEVSDDDARVMVVRQIVLTDEETAKTVEKKIEKGESFESLASYYSSSSNSKITLYKQDNSDAVNEALASLGDGDISQCVEEDGKYYFYEVVEKIDRELTEENKITIVKERASETFDNVYAQFCSNLSSTYNHKLWDEFTVDAEVKLTTDSFFDVFEQYLGFLKQE